jgi:hypothetical protein
MEAAAVEEGLFTGEQVKVMVRFNCDHHLILELWLNQIILDQRKITTGKSVPSLLKSY